MKLDDKIAHAKHLIYDMRDTRAALMCSFGKDSMVLLHLIRETFPLNKMNCHGYPIPIIYHRHPFFPAKNEFADSVIRSWCLEVHNYLPVAAGVKCNESRLELVARYSLPDGVMDFPINTEEPIPRRSYICGLNDWILRPKAFGMTAPWETLFIGHKSSDVDPFEGPVPIRCDQTEAGGATLVFPLRHWTDTDVWDYIETNFVEYDKRRYWNRVEIEDTWLNPDYIRACTKCIDPRNDAEEVYCPKLRTNVLNYGAQVLRLEQLPEYIERDEKPASREASQATEEICHTKMS